MKIYRFAVADRIKTGVLRDEKLFVIENDQVTKQSYELARIKFLPPAQPSKIVCVGRNYAAHAAELGNEVPQEPLLFLKAPSSLITNEEFIVLPDQSERVEHEGELAVIIGRKCKNMSSSQNSAEFIAGYTLLNDVTARDLQKKDVQFTRAKSFDTFCPIASFIETDFDNRDARLTTKVNGVIKQDGRTSQMIFSVDFLIKYISQHMTLEAGDIIATGTPSGVSPLRDGDVCEVYIEGIGNLTNPVRSAKTA
jgi:2-keto-4-pentenoate hydratase/2-oxohepta-3-ene-1,7-dioic acid hydratase in catechol pathway